MQLKEIKEEKCDTCGAEIVAESIRHFHTNGHGFEEREFKCGKRIAFLPNGMCTKIQNECPKSPEVTERVGKRQETFKQLMKVIEKADVDEHWKKEVTNSLNYYRSGLPRI